MIIFKHSGDLRYYLSRNNNSTALKGFVPTMGALHEGHLSLIEQCKTQTDLTICSIFVNPTQFNNPTDFEKYPITVEKDITFLEKSGCDILFLPDEKEIYPDNASRNKYFELGYLETILEGKFRPGHFQGVCSVIENLLNIVNPDYLFIGQKDFQQCLVIKELITLLQRETKIVVCPTLREANGLALSSRNLRLNDSEKLVASELYQRLVQIKNQLTISNFLILKSKAISYLEDRGFKIEYLELAKSKNLELVTKIDLNESLVILVAAFLNEVRLIDNVLIN
ncbi:MAG: pantoate--beta-alanine ligase [Bacteroidota bacterium]|jgi:pantoate--beta-alanine ligase|nr:pantoate--beta-alanine ligase [Bacteroidota bacterium]